MKLRAAFNEPNCQGHLYLLKKDEALYFDPSCTGQGCSSLIINDLELVVDADNSIVCVEGYFPESSWNYARLTPPVSRAGKLYIDDESYSAIESAGISNRLTEPAGWRVAKDLNSGWFCIGRSISKDEIVVEFSSKQKAVLDQEGELVAIWIRPAVKGQI